MCENEQVTFSLEQLSELAKTVEPGGNQLEPNGTSLCMEELGRGFFRFFCGFLVVVLTHVLLFFNMFWKEFGGYFEFELKTFYLEKFGISPSLKAIDGSF